jgi:hypothetical protein
MLHVNTNDQKMHITKLRAILYLQPGGSAHSKLHLELLDGYLLEHKSAPGGKRVRWKGTYESHWLGKKEIWGAVLSTFNIHIMLTHWRLEGQICPFTVRWQWTRGTNFSS